MKYADIGGFSGFLSAIFALCSVILDAVRGKIHGLPHGYFNMLI